MGSPQRFPLPTLPFAREISHPGVGSEVLLRAAPFADRSSKTFSVGIECEYSTALLLSCRVGADGEVAATATVSGTATSEVAKRCQLPAQKPFRLLITAKEHVFEVFLNDVFVLDFVHRVNPLDFRSVRIDGALIVEEVVIAPGHVPSAMVDPLPPPPAYGSALTYGPASSTVPAPASSAPSIPVIAPARQLDEIEARLRGLVVGGGNATSTGLQNSFNATGTYSAPAPMPAGTLPGATTLSKPTGPPGYGNTPIMQGTAQPGSANPLYYNSGGFPPAPSAPPNGPSGQPPRAEDGWPPAPGFKGSGEPPRVVAPEESASLEEKRRYLEQAGLTDKLRPQKQPLPTGVQMAANTPTYPPQVVPQVMPATRSPPYPVGPPQPALPSVPSTLSSASAPPPPPVYPMPTAPTYQNVNPGYPPGPQPVPNVYPGPGGSSGNMPPPTRVYPGSGGPSTVLPPPPHTNYYPPTTNYNPATDYNVYPGPPTSQPPQNHYQGYAPAVQPYISGYPGPSYSNYDAPTFIQHGLVAQPPVIHYASHCHVRRCSSDSC